jgi:SAM-dependent methyltransferase
VEERYYSEYYEVEDTHWWFLGRRAVFLRVLDRYLGGAGDGAAPRRVLDFGCGTGTMMPHLERYGEVEGADADEQAVAMCRRRGLERVTHVGAPPLPFEDGRFGLVTALDVIEHTDDDLGLLRELFRVTRPGGLLLVSVPAYRWLWGPQDEISHHGRRYVAREVSERVRAAGFAIRHQSYFNTLLFPPVAAVRLLRLGGRAGARAGAGASAGPGPGAGGSGARGELRSDFELTKPGRVNDVLARVFAAEAPLVERFRLPFGVSILALAERPPS